MYSFHASIHARSSTAREGEPIQIAGSAVHPLNVTPGDMPLMAASFEQAFEVLNVLPRMLIEPDGSFVWRSSTDDPSWQVDGVLYDRSGRLIYVELNGHCLAENFDQLLVACGWPDNSLMFQLNRHAVFLNEEDFRRLAEAAGQADGWQP